MQGEREAVIFSANLSGEINTTTLPAGRGLMSGVRRQNVHQ